MTEKYFVPENQEKPISQIGATLDSLSHTIEARKQSGSESYTFRLLTGSTDTLVKKVMEEAAEVALAAKDIDAYTAQLLHQPENSEHAIAAQVDLETQREHDLDHLRYEAADVVYHLLVILSRYGISNEEFAAELNMRMKEEERHEGAALLHPEFVNRG